MTLLPAALTTDDSAMREALRQAKVEVLREAADLGGIRLSVDELIAKIERMADELAKVKP